MTKPFQMEEVLARLRALIRRASGQAVPALRCGAIVLDPRAARVTVNGAPVRLTSHEFRVLSYLMHHRGRVVSQGELAEHIYALDADRDSNTVEVFIGRLRKKMGAARDCDRARPRAIAWRAHEAAVAARPPGGGRGASGSPASSWPPPARSGRSSFIHIPARRCWFTTGC